MAGLAKICKRYGSMKVQGADGKTAEWVYDYASDKPRLKAGKKGKIKSNG